MTRRLRLALLALLVLLGGSATAWAQGAVPALRNGYYNSSLPTLPSGSTGFLAVDVNGRLIIAPTSTIQISNFPSSQAVTNAGAFAVQNTAATPPGGNNIGRVGVDTASVAGGLTTVSRIVISAASTNPTVAKASAGRAYKITGYNAASSLRWLHFYNTASAPTVGSTAVFFALPLPPGAFSFDAQDIGYTFSTGIAFGLSTGASDTDATAVAAGDLLNLNVWVQ